jgi:tetratricopeptide (TPR) repeat protein
MRLTTLFLLLTLAAAAQPPQEAVAALQHSDFLAAEKLARAALQSHPNDPALLSLLAVSLDGQKRYTEADQLHRRAIAAAPQSPDALNNYANHQLAQGSPDAARATYLKVIVLDPAHFNATAQLARLALARKNGAEALEYLKRLPDAPNIAILRMQAAYLAGDTAEAGRAFTSLSAGARNNAPLAYAAGMALAEAGQFDKAESFFALALASAPADFNTLANLGTAASRAGHNERARDALETALRQQPQNVDVLYNLAFVDHELKQTDAAVRLLVQAARQAPRRADVQKLLAIATSDIGALPDAAAAWDRYLKLEPGDDSARRERGFTAVQMGQFEKGVADLQWYLSRHPDDAVGHYELAMAETRDDPAKSLLGLDKALKLKPDLVVARSARGSLYYQQGRFAEAAADLEAAAALRPADAVILDRLGQTYLSLDRSADAVRVLRKAAELAPEDSKTQLHFARALADAGESAESKLAMDRFRRLGPPVNKSVPGGLVDYLSLTPEQQHADYAARAAKAAREKPDDAPSQAAWLQVLLEDGNLTQVPALTRRIVAMKPGGAVLAGAGRALLQARQYGLARELLEASGGDVEPDLTIARAQLLDAAGKHEEAVAAVSRIASERPDVAWQTASLLLRNGRTTEALRLLGGAANLEIQLMKALVLELAGQSAGAGRLLGEIQNRRPEWFAVWAARGMILAAREQPEARQTLEIAVALGARGSAVRNVLAGKATADLAAFFQAKPPNEW